MHGKYPAQQTLLSGDVVGDTSGRHGDCLQLLGEVDDTFFVCPKKLFAGQSGAIQACDCG